MDGTQLTKQFPEKKCARAACPYTFRAKNPRRLYCSTRCKRLAQKERHPGRSAEQQRALRRANPEQYRERERRWRARNPEKVEAKRVKERAKYAENPGKFRQYQRDWRAKKGPEKVRAEARAYRASRREVFRKKGREDYAKHSEKRKAQSKAWYARRAGLLAEAERVLNQRSPEELTDAARVTVAAALTIQGKAKRAMRDELFANQNKPERRYDDTKQFFRRKRAQIDAEVERLRRLTKRDFEAAVESARSHLQPESFQQN